MDKLKVLFLLLVLALPGYLSAADKININTANRETLMTIKGVGEKRADAIISYRDANGSFKSVDELANVSGVGESIVEKNRDNLTIDE